MTSTETSTVPAATVSPAGHSLRTRLSALGTRVRALDPVPVVGWLIAVGLALLAALATLATPLIPPFNAEWTFRMLTPGEVYSRNEPTELLVGWVLFARIAGVSVVVGVLLARRSVVIGTVLTAWPFLAIPIFGTFVFAWLLGVAAVAVVAAFGRLRRAVVPYLLVVGIFVAFTILAPNGRMIETLVPLGTATATGNSPSGWWTVFGVGAYLGLAVAVSAAFGAALRSRARSAAARATERHALEVESTAATRAELARDLHDVVAHHVSLVAVRAESAPFTHPGMDDEARAVLRDIAADARSALDELRRVLAILQRSADRPELTPQPGVDAVAALVDEARAAGQQVEVVGELSDVPAAPGYVLYRAAQEGLTNARRHAPGAATVLTLTRRDDVVGLRIANPVVTEPDADPGRGLIGMRERVEALGGAMSAGVEGDTFVVVVSLPLDAR